MGVNAKTMYTVLRRHRPSYRAACPSPYRFYQYRATSTCTFATTAANQPDLVIPLQRFLHVHFPW